MTRMDLSEEEALLVSVVRQHVQHGHGEIKIQIRPGSMRIQEGKGHLFELPEQRRRSGCGNLRAENEKRS